MWGESSSDYCSRSILNHMKRGFTLIELLVVIAIVGVLSSVVLASLNSAREKGADAAIMSNLGGAQAQSDLFFDTNNNSYMSNATTGNICYSTGAVNGIPGVYKLVKAAAEAYGGPSKTVDSVNNNAGAWNKASCHSSVNAWAAAVPLKSSTASATKLYCVDSTGAKMVTANAFISNQTDCQ